MRAEYDGVLVVDHVESREESLDRCLGVVVCRQRFRLVDDEGCCRERGVCERDGGGVALDASFFVGGVDWEASSCVDVAEGVGTRLPEVYEYVAGVTLQRVRWSVRSSEELGRGIEDVGSRLRCDVYESLDHVVEVGVELVRERVV